MSSEQQQLEAAIATLEAQRSTLGDVVADAMLFGLRAKLAVLGAQPTLPPEPAQTLKQVSILFLDVVGSTTLSQRLDPEEFSDVVDGVLRRSTAIVYGHGGRVLQYAGDSILAAFGSEAAAEDDAERAVRCGLSLLSLGQALSAEVYAAYGHAGCDVRVGIHTGGVLIGGGGGGAGDESAIRGVAVNIAARMEQTAPAGALRISRDSYQQVRGLFDVAVQAPLAVKGIDEPIASYLVLKAKPRRFRIPSRGIEGVATRMVGRDTEFKALQDAFTRLFAERRWLQVSVVAEAGIGKSRLLDEFQAWTEDRPETVCLFRGRATPQTQGQPFGLLRDIVAWRMQLSDDDTLDEAKAKIEQELMPLFANEPDYAEGHAHLLGHLIGLDWKDSPHLRGILDDPKQIRNRAQHAAAQMFRRFGAQSDSPVILQLEDLHWADDESLDFLDYLSEVNRDMPLLVLAFSRPTLFERRGDWRRNDERHERLDLYPLDNASSHVLVDELLKKLPQVPHALRELVTGGAEGNPFYMEELVRMLIDQGTIDASSDPWRLHASRLLTAQVPSTLTGVLQARLDGLPVAERLTMQEASVIGQVFWDRALLALDANSEATLPRLVQRELALPRHLAGSDGLREYAFKHALLHQVTYGTVLKRNRRLLHGQLANWLAMQSQSDSARAGDFLGLTAQHYEEAGDHASAAEFHTRTAERAAGRLAHAATLERVGQALALLDREGDSPAQAPLRWRLLHARERTLHIQGNRKLQGADHDTMDRVAEMLDDDGLRAYAVYRRALRLIYMARDSECEQAARRAVALAEAALASKENSPAPDAGASLHELRLLSLRLVGWAMTEQPARWDDAQALLQQTLDEATARGLFKLQSLCRSSLVLLADLRGDPMRMLALEYENLDEFRRAGDRRNEATSLSNVGVAWLFLGDLVSAQRDLEAGLQLMRQNGDRTNESMTLRNLSVLAQWQGDAVRALELARSAIDAAVAVEARDFEAIAMFCLGNAEAALRRFAPAAQAYADARRVAREIDRAVQFDAGAGLARVALEQGDLDAALEALRPLLPPGDAGARTEMTAETAPSMEQATGVSVASNFDAANFPRLIELTLHRVLAAAGDPRATAWLQRAHDALLNQADTITDAALRQNFLTKIPHHREIGALWAVRQTDR